jgi:hypothetical protein
MDVTFRSAPVVSAPTPKGPEPEVNNQQVQSGEDDKEPVELRETHGVSVVLDALGIDDRIDNLPEEDKSNVANVKDYVMEIVKSKGLSPTVGAFKKTIDGLKEDMGLDQEAEPSVILDRIAGVVKAWKNLSFIKDPAEKRKIFFKLAHLTSSAEMNKEVYRQMENYKVWETR